MGDASDDAIFGMVDRFLNGRPYRKGRFYRPPAGKRHYTPKGTPAMVYASKTEKNRAKKQRKKERQRAHALAHSIRN